MIKLEQGEKILIIVRKHWFVLFAQVFFMAVAFLFPFVAYGVLDNAGMFHKIIGNMRGDTRSLLMVLGTGWVLLFWIAFFVAWTNYYLNFLFLTNTKVTDINQRGLFSREMSSVRLDRIQDVTVEVNGIIPTILHFGNVHIQTAAEREEFFIRNVPFPYDVKDKIFSAHHKAAEGEGKTVGGIV